MYCTIYLDIIDMLISQMSITNRHNRAVQNWKT